MLGLGLVAERLDGRGRRADPDQPGVDDGLGEVGVLGEEAVARVHRVGARLLRDRDDLVDVEVGLGRGGAAQRVGLVGEPDEQGVTVGVGVDRHAPDSGVLARADHADRDLAAVRDEDLLQWLAVRHLALLLLAVGLRCAGYRHGRVGPRQVSSPRSQPPAHDHPGGGAADHLGEARAFVEAA